MKNFFCGAMAQSTLHVSKWSSHFVQHRAGLGVTGSAMMAELAGNVWTFEELFETVSAH